jgi:tetratricopeptide (TPR) repeat protein
MTMRLDIVTNDAGEGVRREHARELGAGVVIAIYRLAKLAQMHDLTNQAFTRQLEQTHQIIGDYCLRSGSNVNVMFADKAVFVAGQLLKGSRSTYEAATELGALFERLGGSELSIQRDLTREELLAFAEQISIGYRAGAGTFRSPTPKIRLRAVADAARLRGLELENLSPDQRIVRMYASAVVIMRRFFEDLQASRYILPRRIKRIAQSLVDLSEGSTPAFLGVTEVRNANFDEAGRAVNTAILAVSMAREVTQDRAILSQIAMAGMMHDVARPRAMALSQAAGPAMPGMAGPTTLSEDQEDRLAAGAAAVLTALGRVNEPSITRTVLTFEALWLRRQQWLGPVYWGARSPTLHAKLIAIARRYNDLLTPEPGLLPPTPDYAVAALSEELKDPQDRTVLRMLVSALGLLPMGTVVQLATGEVAEVIRGPKGPGEKPRVRLVMDQNGQQLQPVEIELAQDPHRQVVRVMSVDGWRKGLDLRPGVQGEAYGDERDSQPPAELEPLPQPPQPQVQQQPSYAAPVARPAMPVPAMAASLPPISPLAPIAMPPPGGTAHAQQTSRSIADQYADQYAGWSGEEVEAEAARNETGSSIQSGEHNSSASLPSMGSSPSAVAEAMGRMINDSLAPPAPGGHSPDRTLFQVHGDEHADRNTHRPGQARASREPTARGNLAATPLPHVLVYMLDHSLTGSVLFQGGEGEDTIYFVGGVPTKIRLNDQVALLGQILVHGGAIETKAVEQAVEGARRLGILLGEYLVGHDLVSREALLWALEAQLLNKIAYLANLAPEITYSYYREVDLLEGWGGGDVPVGCPLNPILASVRNWMDRARIRATLNRIGKHPLVLHEDSALTSLALLPEEEATLDMIRSEGMPLAQLFKRNVAEEEVVSSLVYSLAVTRQFAFKGQKKGPMASAQAAHWKAASAAPAASGSIPVADGGAGGSGAGSAPSAPAPAPPSPHRAPAAAPPPAPAPNPVVPSSSRGGLPAGPATSRSNVGPPPPSVRTPPAATAPSSARKQPTGPGVPAPTPAPTPRAMIPAARPPAPGAPQPGLPRASAPQIRPITAKKATMVGIQPAVTAELRQGASAAASPPKAAPPVSTPPVPPSSAPAEEEPPREDERPSMSPSDEAKTIARPSPAFIQAKLAEAAAAARAAKAAAGGAPSASRPAPALPSKLAAARTGGAAAASSALAPKPAPNASGASSKIPGARSGLAQPSPKPPVVAPVPAQSVPGAVLAPAISSSNGNGIGGDDDIDIELDMGGGSLNSSVVELGDDGMADAEAALEAMQSFRLAEAALQRNDIAGAEKLARKAVDADPAQIDYVTLLAWIRALNNDAAAVEEAIATMTQALSDDPSSERALLYRGKLLSRTNRFQEALADFNELLAANPQNRDAQAEVRHLKSKT